MRHTIVFFAISILSTHAFSDTCGSSSCISNVTQNTVLTNTPASPGMISVQKMLVIGPPQLKLHSLTMIVQGKVEGGVDESYLPGLKVCAEDSNAPIRSLTAKLMGQHFVQDKTEPNHEAVLLLKKMATDESSYVRYNAIYYGISEINNKSDEIVSILIDAASMNREQELYECITQSLKNNREQVMRALDEKLKKDDAIAFYEIYEDFTGKKPIHAEKYLEMPSSRPRLFIFKGEGDDATAFKSEFEQALQAVGIEDPDLMISNVGDNYVLMLKTYLTKDYMAVKEQFSKHSRFKITQDMWLTPKLEVQIEATQKKK